MACFKIGNPGGGCDCGGPCFYEPWIVNACGGHITSATVTATDGTTTITASVVGDQYYFSFPNAGTWTRTFARDLFTTQTRTSTVTCNPLSPVPSVVSLVPIAGYSCGDNACCPQPGPPYLPVRWPTTIYLNDGLGIITMTGGGASSTWTGCAMRTAAQAYDCSVTNGTFSFGDPCYGKVVAGVSVPVYFTITCNTLVVRFARCQMPANPPNACNTSQCLDGFGSLGTGDCNGGTMQGLPAVNVCPAPVLPTCAGDYLNTASGPAAVVLAGTNTATCPSSIAVAVSGALGAHYWSTGQDWFSNQPCGNADPTYAAFQVYGGTLNASWST